MVRFDYDSIMKRHNVIVPFTLAGETSETTIASISEDNRLTTHRELKISLVRQILMHWDEHTHMLRMKDAREAGEFDKYFDEEDDSNKPTFH